MIAVCLALVVAVVVVVVGAVVMYVVVLVVVVASAIFVVVEVVVEVVLRRVVVDLIDEWELRDDLVKADRDLHFRTRREPCDTPPEGSFARPPDGACNQADKSSRHEHGRGRRCNIASMALAS